jgi:hypothetical protein
MDCCFTALHIHTYGDHGIVCCGCWVESGVAVVVDDEVVVLGVGCCCLPQTGLLHLCCWYWY